MCSLFTCAPSGHSVSWTVGPHNVSLRVWKSKLKDWNSKCQSVPRYFQPCTGECLHEHAITFDKEWWISDLVPGFVISTSPPSSSCLSELFTTVWVCFLQVVTAWRLLITLIWRRITRIMIEEAWGKHPPRVQRNLTVFSGKTLMISANSSSLNCDPKWKPWYYVIISP